MTDFIRETRMLELLPDDQIRRELLQQLQEMGSPPDSMVLTWRKEKLEYLLEIVLTRKAATVEPWRLTVGSVRVHDCDALNRLAIAGRRLYFRLREEFPALQRKLSRYQYFTEK